MNVGYVVTTSFNDERSKEVPEAEWDDALAEIAKCVNSGNLDRATELLKELNEEIKLAGGNVCKVCGAIEGHADPDIHGSAKWQPGVCWKCY